MGGSLSTARRGLAWLRANPATVCIFVVLTVLMALQSVDALLKAMHRPGDASYSVNDLVRAFPGRSDPGDVVATWKRWADSTTAPPSLEWHWLARLYLILDLVFIPFYTRLIVLTSARLRRATADALSKRLLGGFGRLAVVVGVADVAEDIWQFRLLNGHGAAWPGWLFWGTKWLFFAVIVIGLFAEGLRTLARRWNPWTRDRIVQLLICRVQVIVALFLCLVFFGPTTLSEQAADVVRRISDDWIAALPVVGLALALTAALAVTAISLIANSDTLRTNSGEGAEEEGEEEPEERPRRVWIVVGLLALVGIVAGVLLTDQGRGLLIAIGIGAFVVVSSLLLADAAPVTAWSATESTSVPALLAAVPLTSLGVAMFALAVGDVAYSSNGRSWILLVGGLLLAVGGFFVYHLVRSRLFDVLAPFTRGRGRAARPLVLFAAWGGTGLVLSSVPMVVAILWPWWFGKVVGGTIGVLLAFSFSVLCIGFTLVLLADMIQPPAVFRYLGVRRIPVVTLMLVWFVLASQLDPTGFHTIRQKDAATPAPRAETLDAAFFRWKHDRAASTTGGKVIPLVFVTAVGGGIRAAYWTSIVLQCLVEDPSGCETGIRVPAENLFLASGASGGSLGLVEYTAHRTNPAGPGENAWTDRLNADVLAPTLARTLFLDLPNSFWRLQWFDDRAAILEKSWEREWDVGGGTSKSPARNPMRAGLADLFSKRDVWPRLLLNGTSVVDGCRVETSSLATSSLVRGDKGSQLVDDCTSLRRLDPPLPGSNAQPGWFLGGTTDLASYLCSTADVRLSTAALLSARFPIVSPSGRVHCGGGRSLYVVDGGYWDNTATGAVTEAYVHLLPRIAEFNRRNRGTRCIVPTLIQIDNHYADAAGPKDAARPKETLVPTQTLKTVRDGRDADAREVAALLFTGARFAAGQRVLAGNAPLKRFAHIYPHVHPGVQAPLGWTLSRFSRRDLQGQLRQGENRAQLTQVRRWFGKNVTCVVK